MQSSRIVFCFAAAACLTLSPAYADSHAPQPHGNKPATAGKPATSGKPSSGGTTSGPGTTSGSTSTSSGTTTTSGSTTTTQLNPIAAKISSHPQLKNKITGMLPIDPATGKTMTLNQASMGFKNQGQFIAALHVSQNLGISFLDLRKQMITTTKTGDGTASTQTMSLGQAIQAVKKTANSTSEVEKAETQANADLSATTTTSTSTSPNKTKKKTTTSGGGQ
jgi:hypothetical protein